MSQADLRAAVDALITREKLPRDYATVVTDYWAPLANFVAACKLPDQPLLVGINGAQGSGKSTLCHFLELLLHQRGLQAITVSLDDLYLRKAERAELADAVHPLFATRGVPGTHDTALAHKVFDDLLGGQPADVPRFDKAVDDRSPDAHSSTPPVDIVLFEGWCVGARPQDEVALAEPVNSLEREEDPLGIWRGTVNRYLQTDYAALFARMDILVMLAVPGFESVKANRLLQERKLAAARPDAAGLMDEAAVERFIMHYERLTRHIAQEMPARADVVLRLGDDQRPIGLPPVLTDFINR
ncbi:kinase [Altererythrobacter xixiisoli]|uniref:Kinase n=1 Tax=Croceibacterium xixiisoli TaxID=1476466 RepID=A0A6I4TR26_9SPHN|nr:kinase [Croceibacterium xixiisoli]MXO98376.1 kinase [Croceibacterium xixiisoli]